MGISFIINVFLVLIEGVCIAKMEMVILSSETIKPTPHQMRNLKLSLLDQINMGLPDLPSLLFYSAPPLQNTNMASLLKKFLPRTLDEFYPLAGRLSSDKSSIECNDSGVEFIEARVNAPFVLRQLLSDPNAEELHQLLPPGTKATAGGYLCTIQVTIFEGCGSMVLGVCISHMIGDASALSMFLDTWAAIARGDKIVSPKFGFASIIPPRDLPAITRPSSNHEGIPKIVTKRLVLNKSEVAALIFNCADQSPTRVHVACAFMFMCFINVLRSESSKPIAFTMPIGCRPRMTPPVPPHYLGNLAFTPLLEVITEPESFPSLVGRVRQMIRNIDSEYLKNMLADDAKLLFSHIQSLFSQLFKFHRLIISSFCGLAFYKADFGWGRPIWAASFCLNVNHSVMLLDTKNGGVEAWVTLNEDHMTKFGYEHQLLLADFGAPSIPSKI